MVTTLGHFLTGLDEWDPRVMDSYREHPSDFDQPGPAETTAADDVAAAIGTDERRMHVRAYNYWVSLLDGRDFPSIEDLEPGDVQDFAPNSVLLDFTCGHENPAMPYIGTAIRDECGLDDDMRTTAEVPSRSLLSRLTDHYLQIIANRAPIGFEAEFLNQREETICYRGILMPFSSDGDSIDFIYGVINWKANSDDTAAEPAPAARSDTSDEAVLALEAAASVETPVEAPAVEEAEEFEVPFDPHAAFDSAGEEPAAAQAPVHFSWEDGPLADTDADAEPLSEITLDDDAGLADWLWAARETAEAMKLGEGRTRGALYQSLALAYDFAVTAQNNPKDYADLLEESGVKAQARAPMTAVVKLVFGIDYDKARLTEFAAALSFAQRQQVALGGFKPFIENHPGALKGLVAAERQARRPEAKPDTRGDAARAKLRAAAPLSLAEISADAEFAVVVTRRRADGSYEPIALIDDETLVERVIRSAA
jgi:hypothetical protein